LRRFLMLAASSKALAMANSETGAVAARCFIAQE